ncbi:MAG: glycosyl transferase family 90 [Azospirillaceae bacterium]
MSRLSTLIRRLPTAAVLAEWACPRRAEDLSEPVEEAASFPFFRWSLALRDGRLLPHLPFPRALIRVDDLALVVDALDRAFRRDRPVGSRGRIRVWLADEPPPIDATRDATSAELDAGRPWLAYGREVGRADTVLMPDGYFMRSDGYAALRRLAASGRLPAWAERRDVLFWRGAPTGHGAELTQVPRVRLVAGCADTPGMDIAFSSTDGRKPDEIAILRHHLASRAAFRPAVPMAGWARFRYLVDIDGFGNAWGFFERLLLGSCVLKVESAVEQWFYRHLVPGTHYLPVRDDLADLPDRLAWCRSNPDRAQAIGRAGQAFALAHTAEIAIAETAEALRAALAHLPCAATNAGQPAGWQVLRYRGYLRLLKRQCDLDARRQA